MQSDYFQAEEKVKLAYMAVKTEIMMQKVADSSYDATNAIKAGELLAIVKKDLTGTEWTSGDSVEYPKLEGSTIKIRYSKSTLKEGGISTEPKKPYQSGYVDYEIELKKQDASLIMDRIEVATGSETNGGKSKRASITPAPTGATYTEGQEVTFGNEKFFVLSDDGTTVKLLAKYCLNRAATEQLLEDENEEWYGSNYAYYGYGKPFSNTTYWESEIANSNSPIDLQTESMIEKAKADGNVEVETEQGESSEVPNAVVSAINYGTLKGVKGRLMTYSEVDTILKGTNNTMKNLIFGCWDDGTEPSDRWLDWWLGDATEEGVFSYRYCLCS